MQDGLYAVSFQTAQGIGAGVIVKQGSMVAGGDSAYAWSGQINEDGDKVSGQLKVVKHGSTMTSVFGPLNNFSLSFTGSHTENSGRLTATTPAAPGVNMSISLRALQV